MRSIKSFKYKYFSHNGEYRSQIHEISRMVGSNLIPVMVTYKSRSIIIVVIIINGSKTFNRDQVKRIPHAIALLHLIVLLRMRVDHL